MLFGHIGHGGAEGRAAVCLDERRVVAVEDGGLLDERRIGFFGVGGQPLHHLG